MIANDITGSVRVSGCLDMDTTVYVSRDVGFIRLRDLVNCYDQQHTRKLYDIKTCKFCGIDHFAGAKFCWSCGSTLL